MNIVPIFRSYWLHCVLPYSTVYDLIMASLTHKFVGRRKYYYARICKRVNGKPKIVQTVYLGAAERMIQNAQSPAPRPAAEEVFIVELGAMAALYDVAQQLQFVAIVDRHAPKRHQGPSTGLYMLIAALNRAIAPCSKAALAEWFEQTIGPRLLGVKASELCSQAFWNHMDRLDAERLARIENDLLQRLVNHFHIELSSLLYDGTNFYTYINTNTASQLAHRGHNKQKRTDLRQVSLGLITSTDFHVPLLHMLYGGNIADATQFGSIIEGLVQRYRTLTEACAHITLVFDKGNNSEENFDAFAQTGLHFVGSLKLCQCPDLLQIPLAQYRPLSGDGLEEVRAYRVRQAVFGQERTLLMTYNENLLAGQLQGIGRNLGKCRQELQHLQTQLRRWANGKITKGRRPTRESAEKRVQSILHREYMKDIMKVKVEQTDGGIHLRYHVNQDALAQLAETVLGKTLLFTDNDSWSDEQIVLAYRGLYHIEHAFRDMKNPHFLGWNPRLHWTDQKIRVHAFYCVAALTFVCLLRRKLAAQGLPLSADRLLSELVNIRETISVYPQRRGKSPELSYALSHLNDTQKQLYRLLNLARYRQLRSYTHNLHLNPAK